MRANGWLLRRAARVLRAGGIVCHATEGAFGLAARAGDSSACLRLRQLKARPGDKKFIVVGAALGQIVALIRLEAVESQPLLDSWPGPETWILPASSKAPRWLAGRRGTIAVRVTAHPQMARLCQLCGPVVSTSANSRGRPPAATLLQARRYFGQRVDFYLPGAVGDPGHLSRIRNGISGEVLRD